MYKTVSPPGQEEYPRNEGEVVETINKNPFNPVLLFKYNLVNNNIEQAVKLLAYFPEMGAFFVSAFFEQANALMVLCRDDANQHADSVFAGNGFQFFKCLCSYPFSRETG